MNDNTNENDWNESEKKELDNFLKQQQEEQEEQQEREREQEREQQDQKDMEQPKSRASRYSKKRVVSTQSVGFQNYLRLLLKFEPQMSKSEVLRFAISKYTMNKACSQQSRNSKRMNHKTQSQSQSLNLNRSRTRSRSQRQSEVQIIDGDSDNTYSLIFGNLNAENFDKCSPKKANCEPSPRTSVGFSNYYKVFLCHYPQYTKCTSMKMARCLYKNLSEATKERYRCLGKFKCCPKKSPPKRRKRSCSPKARSPCRPKPKKCPAQPRRSRSKQRACPAKPRKCNVKRKAASPKPFRCCPLPSPPCPPQPIPCCPQPRPPRQCGPKPRQKPCCSKPKPKRQKPCPQVKPRQRQKACPSQPKAYFCP